MNVTFRRYSSSPAGAPVFALIGLMLVAACSSQYGATAPGGRLPAWVDNPSRAFSDNQYLMAVGSGNTLGEAQENALGSLSRIFQAEINASRELIDDFVETSQNDEFSSERTTQLLNVTRIGSTQDLINTRILTSDVAGDGTYYALAGMDRLESARIYNREITNNDLKIEEYESNAEKENDSLQKLILLRKALVLAEVNENLSRQRNILMRGSSDTELNTVTLNRVREKFRTVQQRVPVSITSETASGTILSAIAGVFQRSGFSVAAGGRDPVLEVRVVYRSHEAELNRQDAEFVQWELVITMINRQSDHSFGSFLAEGRDGGLTFPDALKRADYSARKQIETEFRKFLTQELLAIK